MHFLSILNILLILIASAVALAPGAFSNVAEASFNITLATITNMNPLPPVPLSNIILPDSFQFPTSGSGIITVPPHLLPTNVRPPTSGPSGTKKYEIMFGFCSPKGTSFGLEANVKALQALPAKNTWCCTNDGLCGLTDTRHGGPGSRYCADKKGVCIPCWWVGYAQAKIAENCGPERKGRVEIGLGQKAEMGKVVV